MDYQFEAEIERIQYYVLPSKRVASSTFSLIQDDVFDFWVTEWTRNFSKGGNPKSGWEDHFIRQDIITALTLDQEIIGCHLYSFYNLDSHSTLASEYFNYISSESLKKLRQKRYSDCMSMEYLCVAPKVQRNDFKISFGNLILALGTYIAEDEGADCVLGMPILGFGNKVDKMLENVGGEDIQTGIKKYGYELKLMAAQTNPRVNSKNLTIKKFADHLWHNRHTFCHESVQTKIAV